MRHKLTKKEKETIGLQCCNCNSTLNLIYHHIVPLSIGGADTISNMCCLCEECHKKIHQLTEISYSNLIKITNKKQEKKFPFNEKIFCQQAILYKNRRTTKVQMAKELQISRPTLDKYF